MSDVTQGVDSQPGIDRTSDGTIADQATKADTSNQSTNQAQSTDSAKTESENQPTLLNQKEPPKTDTKPDDKTKTDSKAVPDKYEFKLPDGLELIPEVATEVNTLFKDLGLSAEGGQKLMDFYIAKTQEAMAQPYEAYRQMVAGWGRESADHPDLRGKIGPGQEINVRIGKLLDGLPDQKLATDFREHMDLTGAGNHHAFIRVLDYLASRLTEGTHVAGNGPSKAGQSAPNQAPPSAAAALYPHLPSANRG